MSSCAECIESGGVRMRELAGRRVISIALRDADRVHGVLQLIAYREQEVAPWKLRLLEALARHVGTAIGTVRRVEHQRVLSLMEERSVIARELHDALAQSLSYLKIQVSRLGSALERGSDRRQAGMVLGELREGLNSAYRQLRELLTTLRLRIEKENLAAILEKTAQEFTQRGALIVELETQLTNCALSANEEIHILQIVREALSNVVHHAHAKQARISIHGEAAGQAFVRITDDGVGVGNKSASVHHYGMAIMKDMSGIDVLKVLKAADLDARVIMLTVSDQPEDLLAALRAGADGYLLKDMEPEDLVLKLVEAAHGQLVLSPTLAGILVHAMRQESKPKTPDEAGLTEQERKIVERIAAGKSNKLIARELNIAEGTVKMHVKHLLKKLNLKSRVEAAVWAVERNRRAVVQ